MIEYDLNKILRQHKSDMVKYFVTLFLLMVVAGIAAGQDSSAIAQPYDIRTGRPFFLLLDAGGIGAGYSIHSLIDLQATTMLFASSVGVKVYLTSERSAPFIGLSTGHVYQGFGGNGEANDWVAAAAGWHYHPFRTRGIFIAVMYQYILYEENKRSEIPPMFSFNLGIRIP